VSASALIRVGGGHALGYAVLPAAGFHQVVEEQGDNVVRLNKRAVGVHNAEAVRVAVGRDAEGSADLLHLGSGVAQQVVVWLGSMAAKQTSRKSWNCFAGHAGRQQQVRRVAAARTQNGS